MYPIGNRLVGLLPVEDRKRLLACCETVVLHAAQVLARPGEPATHAYFLLKGRVSLVSTTATGASPEVAMVGVEGMVGAQLALGSDVSWMLGSVQQAGSALCLRTADLRVALDTSVALRDALWGYVHALMGQVATNAVCAHFHEIAPRLARWLLMSQERERSAHLHTTHAAMAHLLGVRRVGITAAAGHLQRSGLIRYARGALTILDRAGLQAVACGCYTARRLRL